MRARKTIVTSIGIGSLAAVAIGITVYLVLTFGTDETSSATVAPIREHEGRPIEVANTVDEAIGMALQMVTEGPPFRIHEVHSISYADTTVGAARNIIDQSRATKTWVTPDDASAWVFVVRGQFETFSIALPTPQPYNTVWVIIPKGIPGETLVNPTNTQYDLRSLGTTVEVALP